LKDHVASKAYAKAIYDLAKEAKVDVADELVKINELINKCNDLENVLFLDVFTPEEKSSVMAELAGKLGTSKLVTNFINLLIIEKRMGIFPSIFKDVVVIDDHDKGFLRGTIQGADSDVDGNFQEKITNYLKNKLGKNCQLNYVQNEKISAGYRVTVEDLQLDASLDNQLEQFKNDVLSL